MSIANVRSILLITGIACGTGERERGSGNSNSNHVFGGEGNVTGQDIDGGWFAG